MGNRHKWAEENKGEKRNKTAAIVTTAREEKEKRPTIIQGHVFALSQGWWKFIWKREGGIDIICMRRQRREGRVICTRSYSFSCLCSARFVLVPRSASVQTRLEKHANTCQKLGWRPPPRRLPQDRRLRSLRNRTVTSLGSPLAVGGWEKPLNHRRPNTQSAPALMQWCMTAAGSWRAAQIDLQAFDNSSRSG